jgi:hypothetical protein
MIKNQFLLSSGKGILHGSGLSSDLRNLPYISYYLKPGQADWSGIILIPVIEGVQSEGTLCLEIVSPDNRIISQTSQPLSKIQSYCPAYFSFPAILNAHQGIFEFRVFAREVQKAVHVLERRSLSFLPKLKRRSACLLCEFVFTAGNYGMETPVPKSGEKSPFPDGCLTSSLNGQTGPNLSLIDSDESSYLHPDVPISSDTYHFNYLIGLGNQPGKKILEIGSREVTGESKARKSFCNASYVGFDFYPGPNVDVVGDAHKLSHYFDEPFDIIYSYAVFEHFAMPWLVALEIAKCLKIGGIICITSHFSFSSHERPWHFFQFSDMALKSLFSPVLGFECIEAGMSNPIIGRFSSGVQDSYLANQRVTGLYCHSTFLGRKVKEVPENFDWMDINLQDVVEATVYPKPKG